VPLTVLIVDDHEGFRQVARALLEADGIQVAGEAADGESAITDAAARLRPQPVLLDIQLPGIDAFERVHREGRAIGRGAVRAFWLRADALGPLRALARWARVRGGGGVGAMHFSAAVPLDGVHA
jgi:CheY-like chemotaxis protein